MEKSTERISFDRMPDAIGKLIQEVTALREEMRDYHQGPSPMARRPMTIEEVCQLIGKAKSTIYSLVCRRRIPCYKAGKKLYFYEDEVLDWIKLGKRATMEEIAMQVPPPNARLKW